jgi:transposase-like protein
VPVGRGMRPPAYHSRHRHTFDALGTFRRVPSCERTFVPPLTVGPDWRVDETYVGIRGRWHYICRAIDGPGQIVDALVSPTRNIAAACTFFERAIASTDDATSGYHR